MDDACLVRGFQRRSDLLGERQRVAERHGPLGDALRERLPLDQLEHERMRGAAVFEAVDGGDVRMIERREHLRFATESRQPVGIADDGVRQQLQRDVALQLGVSSAIHLAHGARAEGADDVVGTEPGAGGQGQSTSKVPGFYVASPRARSHVALARRARAPLRAATLSRNRGRKPPVGAGRTARGAGDAGRHW